MFGAASRVASSPLACTVDLLAGVASLVSANP
jgi:hypothetical protein